jgi:CubicO group peptidase (beta-lactamase class C family)
MSRIGRLSLAYAPGTEWRYGPATSVLGYLIEVASGQPFPVFLEERIFRPLRMADTGFFVPQSGGDRVPAAYTVTEEGVTEDLWPTLRATETKMPLAPSGAGGLFSTAQDYLRFLQMLLNGGELDGTRILSPKTVELMLLDHLPHGVGLLPQWGPHIGFDGYGFGLGVAVRTDLAKSQLLGSVGSFSWGGAYGTYFFADPQEELIACFFVQLQNSGAYPIRRQFNNVVYQSIVR